MGPGAAPIFGWERGGPPSEEPAELQIRCSAGPVTMNSIVPGAVGFESATVRHRKPLSDASRGDVPNCWGLLEIEHGKGRLMMLLQRGNLEKRWFFGWLCAVFIVSLAWTVEANTGQIPSDQKAKVKGTIASRNGELVTVKDKKTGTKTVVDITDDTKIERKHGKVEFFRSTDMDVTAMVPGLTIEAEGVGNAKGQLVAKKITFSPDEFAVEVAEEQQILANQAAAAKAQTTANQGVKDAKLAQASANKAQATANAAGTNAQAADAGALMDAAAIQLVNQRVSDLDSYKTVAEAAIYFAPDGSLSMTRPKRILRRWRPTRTEESPVTSWRSQVTPRALAPSNSIRS